MENDLRLVNYYSNNNAEDAEKEEDPSTEVDDVADDDENEVLITRLLAQLTDEEREAALQLRQAAMDDPDVEVPCDFECVQHALVANGNIQEALNRIVGLQHFRNEYDIKDTVEDAVQSINNLMEHHPGIVLHFEERPIQTAGFDDDASREYGGTYYLFVTDFNHIDSANAIEHPNFFIPGMYYCYQATFPHFDAIKEGHLNIVESEGVSWKDHIAHFEFHVKVASQIWQIYPAKVKEISIYNNPSAFNVIYSLMKPFLDDHFKQNVRLGCRLDEESTIGSTDDINIRELFSPAPTPLRKDRSEFEPLEKNTELFWKAVLQAWSTRFRNAQIFRL